MQRSDLFFFKKKKTTTSKLKPVDFASFEMKFNICICFMFDWTQRKRDNKCQFEISGAVRISQQIKAKLS